VITACLTKIISIVVPLCLALWPKFSSSDKTPVGGNLKLLAPKSPVKNQWEMSQMIWPIFFYTDGTTETEECV